MRGFLKLEDLLSKLIPNLKRLISLSASSFSSLFEQRPRNWHEGCFQEQFITADEVLIRILAQLQLLRDTCFAHETEGSLDTYSSSRAAPSRFCAKSAFSPPPPPRHKKSGLPSLACLFNLIFLKASRTIPNQASGSLPVASNTLQT